VHRSAVVCLALLIATSDVAAEDPASLVASGGTKADYERAAAMQHRVRGKVRNARLQVLWVDEARLRY
jgi:hypothetical protein